MSEQRFDQLEQKLDRLDQKLHSLDQKIDGTNDMMRLFVREQSLANRQYKASQSNHEGRIRDLERRPKAR